MNTRTYFGLLSGLLLIASAASAQDSANQKTIPATKLVPAQNTTPAPGKTGPAPKLIAAGSVAPDFVSNDLAGKPVKISDWKGKVLVLDYWATWCGPCMKSLPHTQEVANQFKDQGVVVLAVCTSDTRAKFEEWVKVNQKKYPDIIFTCDPNERGSANYDDRASKKDYGVAGIPTQFIMGRDGKIAASLVGYDADDARLEAALARAGVKVEAATVAKGEKQLQK